MKGKSEEKSWNLDRLKRQVEAAKNGDLKAFTTIVGDFQDMAVGYAYSYLNDFHRAED